MNESISEKLLYLNDARDEYLKQLNETSNGIEFGVGDLLKEIVEPYSHGTDIFPYIPVVMEIFAYTTGLEVVTASFLPGLCKSLDVDKTTERTIPLLYTKALIGFGNVTADKKTLKSLYYVKNQNDEINYFGNWCSRQAERIKNKYALTTENIKSLPELFYINLIQFIANKTGLTKGEELYASFLNDSIDIAFKRFFEDLGMDPVSLYRLRSMTPNGTNNTFCKYCHKSIHRSDVANYCSKSDNRRCYEKNMGTRNKKRTAKEQAFLKDTSKVCSCCNTPLTYDTCRVLYGKLICLNPSCYEHLRYKKYKIK